MGRGKVHVAVAETLLALLMVLFSVVSDTLAMGGLVSFYRLLLF